MFIVMAGDRSPPGPTYVKHERATKSVDK